jgi:thiosulfate dehydrogenase (quinone) large subunit
MSMATRNQRPRHPVSSGAIEPHSLDEVTQVYSIPGYAVLPLRLFLGITFVYAGLQKISDPGFLRPGAPTYIGAQLLSFSHGSPIKFFLLHLMEHAQIIGALTILGELAIGTAVLLGLFTRLAALSGLVLNFVFFLSASWNVTPYFFGSDIVFVVAWLTLALTGPGAFALDGMAQQAISRRFTRLAGWATVGPLHRDEEADSFDPVARVRSAAASTLSRREAVVGGLAAVGLVILALLPRPKIGGGTGAIAAPKAPGSSVSKGAGTGSGTGAAAGGGRKIGNISQVPPNTAGTLTDPSTGDPAIVVRLPDKNLVAYDAVCTHAGCTVQYDPQSHLLICPCHGGEYDPAHGAQVVAGPPPSPLSKLPIRVDSKGNIYLLS